ncbi:MAG: hypothetical protein ABIN80_23720 [Dyadobacter sp.]|uniref:glycosyl-4,4'-diaponeurosporenoate acyltransferase CrtO family protein n=1 Tax=Dyadobacter sp. TaxID=1914288 RepID=UPI0032668D6F
MLNQLINVFWTLASFMAVGSYWGVHFAEKRSPSVLGAIIVVSVLCYMTPRRWLSALTLSENRRTYERIGVKFMLWFVQNGTFVNRIQRKFSKEKAIITSRKKASTYLSTIDMQERYHYCCFVFFILSAISALLIGKTESAFFIMLWNILYNVYPILLQQYNRLRINSVLSVKS